MENEFDTGEDHRLDHRYIVLKKKDVAGLDPKAQASLYRLVNAVNFVREIRKAPPLEGVFIERDWPEYERTVSSLLFRASAERLRDRLRAWGLRVWHRFLNE